MGPFQSSFSVLAKWLDHPRRDAHGHTVVGYITGNDRPSAHDDVIADSHTRQDYASIAEIYVVTHTYGTNYIDIRMLVAEYPDPAVMSFKVCTSSAYMIAELN